MVQEKELDSERVIADGKAESHETSSELGDVLRFLDAVVEGNGEATMGDSIVEHSFDPAFMDFLNALPPPPPTKTAGPTTPPIVVAAPPAPAHLPSPVNRTTPRKVIETILDESSDSDEEGAGARNQPWRDVRAQMKANGNAMPLPIPPAVSKTDQEVTMEEEEVDYSSTPTVVLSIPSEEQTTEIIASSNESPVVDEPAPEEEAATPAPRVVEEIVVVDDDEVETRPTTAVLSGSLLSRSGTTPIKTGRSGKGASQRLAKALSNK